MADADVTQLAGEVEADETFIGGKLRESERRKLRAQDLLNEAVSRTDY